MGTGSWTKDAFCNYVTSSRGVSLEDFSVMDCSAQEVYKSNSLQKELSPYNIMRECCETKEHPNTLPVILALDVTGSMGQAAVKVAQQLNTIMTDIYNADTGYDVEFCVMGIGDLACDHAPIQMSQFESDVRIAEHLDKIYFEFGGGGNSYESYTAAWYMGARHAKLDCWNRGQKGIIITLGDEQLNPYLPKEGWHCDLVAVTGDKVQCNIETEDLYKEVCEKYDVYHISVDDNQSSYDFNNRNGYVDKSWGMLGDNYKVCGMNNLAKTITEIITKRNPATTSINEVSW